MIRLIIVVVSGLLVGVGPTAAQNRDYGLYFKVENNARVWHLLTVKKGTVSLISNLSWGICETARRKLLGLPTTTEEIKKAEQFADEQHKICKRVEYDQQHPYPHLKDHPNCQVVCDKDKVVEWREYQSGACPNIPLVIFKLDTLVDTAECFK